LQPSPHPHSYLRWRCSAVARDAPARVTAAQQEHTSPPAASKKQQLQELQRVMRRQQVEDAMERPPGHAMVLADATVTAVEGEVTVRAQAALVLAMIAPAAVARCRPRSTWPPQLPWLCSDEGHGREERRRKEGAGEATQPTVQPMSNGPPMQCHNARHPLVTHPLHPIEINSLFAMRPSSPWRGVGCSKAQLSTPFLPFPSLPRPRCRRANGPHQKGGGATHDERLLVPPLR
jgi:hypothetical protein